MAIDLEDEDEMIVTKSATSTDDRLTRINHRNRTVVRKWRIENHWDHSQAVANRRLYQRELEALQVLKHRNIVEMIDSTPNHNGFAVIHLKYVSRRSLDKVIFNPGYRYSAHTIICYLIDIFNGVIFLHSNGFLHRDLKPSNILIEENDVGLKLTDFETAKANQMPGETVTYQFGTKQYRPPESFPSYGKEARFDEKGDTYAIGIITWEMIKRSRFYLDEQMPGSYRETLLKKIAECRKEFLEIVEVCTTHSPELRGNLVDVLRHVEMIKTSRLFDQYERTPKFDPTCLLVYPPDGLDLELETEESLDPPPTEFLPIEIIEQQRILNMSKEVTKLKERLQESEKESNEQNKLLIRQKTRRINETIKKLERYLEESLKDQETRQKTKRLRVSAEQVALAEAHFKTMVVYLEEVRKEIQVKGQSIHQNSVESSRTLSPMSLAEEQMLRQIKPRIQRGRELSVLQLPNRSNLFHHIPEDPTF